MIAALDLAEELGVPVEWFALSSGAKIAMDSGTENMDWVAAALKRIVRFTQDGGEINIVVSGINVGAQPYWNAEATMLMHTKGILVMTPESAMVLTGKQALDYSGGVSAEDNFGIGGYERVMGPNGQAQYWAPDLAGACETLLAYYERTYVAPGERFPRRAETADPLDRDVRSSPHELAGSDLSTVGEIFSDETNPGRKKPFDVRAVMRAVADADHEPLERWAGMREAENAVVWDARLGGRPVSLLGIESRPLPRYGPVPADGPEQWSAGTLFPQSSRKIARAINAASGRRPLVVLANLAGFDGSPESMRRLQLEYGAEIGRAIVNFDGPIAFCVISRFHGGAFVVFSRRLNEQLETSALEGSHASVIGGAPAAAVVFAREVDARTRDDARITSLDERIAEAEGGERERCARSATPSGPRCAPRSSASSRPSSTASTACSAPSRSARSIASCPPPGCGRTWSTPSSAASRARSSASTWPSERRPRRGRDRRAAALWCAAPMLHVHRSERADGLVGALAALLAEPLPDPFAPELIAVPTRGMERWLTQRLSTGLGVTPGRADGVCANVEFPSPRRLADEAVAVASGIEPDADAWLPERLVWALLEVVDTSLHEPWLRSLADHLGATLDTADPARQARRFASVRHIAELFDRYALQRPGDGPRVGGRARRRRHGREAPAGRALAGGAVAAAARPRRAARPGGADRGPRARACARSPASSSCPTACRSSASPACPPGACRCCARSPPSATSTCSCCTPRPRCGSASPARRPVVRRAEDVTRELPANRLLASWGQDVRELQLVAGPPADADHHHADRARRTARCSRASRPTCAPTARRPAPPLPGPPGRAARARGDRSIQVHACHGRARQVEVLRDAILHLLAEDPALEPRDVIVMCPDIETFAPLIGATFGAGEISPEDDELEDLPEELRPPDLRVRLADRSLRQTNAGARLRLAPARARRPAPDRLPGARPRRPRARPPALRARRRRRRARGGVGRAVGDPLGAGRRPPRAVQARQAARRHLALRAGPRAARRRDDRRGAAAVRRRAPARRRRERRDRPRGPARGADRPPAGDARPHAPPDDGRRLDRPRSPPRPTR